MIIVIIEIIKNPAAKNSKAKINGTII